MHTKTSFVVIKENELQREDVIKYLEKRAEDDNVSAYSKSLLNEYLSVKELSSYEEVCAFYSSWYSRALLGRLYPEYKDVGVSLSFDKRENGKCDKKDSAYSRLRSLIGLKSVKSLVDDVVNLNKYNKLLLEKNKPVIKISRHMVFTGNPGTAKTTVARLFAEIMKEEGILEVGKLIEVGRQDLVGKYVGWTAKNVERIFESAKGSVLFIDEAYSLQDERAGSFGDEAINTIVQCMENYRDDTIVIFAGYPDKMESFIDRNPGLRSRISWHINFDDYTPNELYSILLLMCKEDGVEIDTSCREKVLSIIEDGRKEKDFGNGRFIRNIYEKARVKTVKRIMKSSSFSDVVLTEDDFALPFALDVKKQRKSIGFNIC